MSQAKKRLTGLAAFAAASQRLILERGRLTLLGQPMSCLVKKNARCYLEAHCQRLAVKSQASLRFACANAMCDACDIHRLNILPFF